MRVIWLVLIVSCLSQVIIETSEVRNITIILKPPSNAQRLINMTTGIAEFEQKIRARVIDFKASSFELYQFGYHKVYSSKRELASRSKLFLKRLNAINKWNKAFDESKVSYKLKANHFADWTKDELAKILSSKDTDTGNKLTGAKSSSKQLSANYRRYENEPNKYSRSVVLPASVDWSKSGCLAEVRDQDKNPASRSMILANRKRSSSASELSLASSQSVQQIIDCASRKREFASTIRGCNGGQPAKVLQYMRQYKVRLAPEGSYPYEARQGICKQPNHSKDLGLMQINYGRFKQTRLDSESQIMEHLANQGPVISSLRVIENFVSYDSGIFDDASRNYRCANSQYNHIILIVGYGRDKASKKDYWIVKNSWGSDWGEEGFSRIARGRDVCRIGKWALGIRLTG